MSVITSLITEFSQCFQDFSVIEKEIKVFSTPFLVDAAEVEERLQLELIEMQYVILWRINISFSPYPTSTIAWKKRSSPFDETPYKNNKESVGLSIHM